MAVITSDVIRHEESQAEDGAAERDIDEEQPSTDEGQGNCKDQKISEKAAKRGTNNSHLGRRV